VNLIVLQTKLAGIDIPAYFVGAPGREDLAWSLDLLDKLPEDTAAELFRQYLNRRKKGEAYNARTANLWLRGRVDWLASMLDAFPVALHALRNEERRAEVAVEQANQSALLLHEMTEFGAVKVEPLECYYQVGVIADTWGFLPPLPAKFPNTEACELWVSSVLVRLLDHTWWERRINRAWDRYTEHGAILLGKVRKGVSAYMSEKNLQVHRNRKRAAALWMRDMLAVNAEHGYEISLEQAIMASVANPKIRRNELMVRMRGFEDIATENGYVGLFITWTAPSRFHSWKQASNGKTIENQKYAGVTPRDTQQYLCSLWAKARAKLKREQIQPFGFRVCEPHHDGTPHWHMLLFVHPDQWTKCISILQEYAISDDTEELERRRNKHGRSCPTFTDFTPRFDWKFIDESKGSATGYIAKYIAKNLDGHAVGIDEETGLPAAETATAVTGWASWWGIRQFQQIGGPSVSVWRELRRVKEIVGPARDPQLEICRRAADVGNWRWYTEAMGGPVCCRVDRPVHLLNIIKEAANKYGEDVTKMVGVFGLREQVETRIDGWEVTKIGLEARGIVPLAARQGGAVALGPGVSRAPRSSDNNCTEDRKREDLDQVLAREFTHLGLGKWEQTRVKQGAVLKQGGLYIWISNGALNTSPHHPGERDEDPLDHQFCVDEAARERRRIGQIRISAKAMMEQGQDIELWLAGFDADEQEIALKQLDELVTSQEKAAKQKQKPERYTVTNDSPEFFYRSNVQGTRTPDEPLWDMN
jgi:hypothetical protein